MDIETDMYPHVTEIISPYVDTRWFLPEHKERGRLIHNVCNIYFETKWIPPYEEKFQFYIDSYIRWFEIFTPEKIAGETEMYDHELKFKGIPDFVGKIKGSDEIGIIDWKTSQQTYKHWILQLAAYKHLVEHTLKLKIKWIATLRLKKDGSNALFNDWSDREYKATTLFLNALELYKYFNPEPKK